jgi:hypothetical protein
MRIAFVLCGAVAREVMGIARRHAWDVAFHGINARAHMRPERIAPLVERKLIELIPKFDRVVVIFGDCGSRGALDSLLERHNVPRLAGAHCYEWYGGAGFQRLMDEEPGTFFLTDFLLRGFDGLVWKGLGLDRFPELQDTYFANYQRLVYLAQRDDGALIERARTVSARLGLPFEVRHTGYGELETRLVALMADIDDPLYRPTLAPAPTEPTNAKT